MLYSIRRRIMLIACACAATVGYAASPADNAGPYNLTFLQGGVGMSRPLTADNPVLSANATWSMTGWMRPALVQPGMWSLLRSVPPQSTPVAA